MELGQVVDYLIEYNEMHGEKKTDGPGAPSDKEEPTRRKATQADIDAFWG